MLSRVAEAIYWMARYVERAECTARLIRVNTHLLLDLPRGISPGWQPLIWITGAQSVFEELYNSFAERQALEFLISREENPGSVITALTAARANARTIRDIVPRECWEQLNELYLYAKDNVSRGLSKRGRAEYLDNVIVAAQTHTGILGSTMNHDEGYQFLRIGRGLERADMTTRIIDVRTASLLENEPTELKPFETIQWMSVLKSLTAYQMYRRSVQSRVRRGDVLRFLFKHPSFPRSVTHVLNAIEGSLARLPQNEAPILALKRLKRRVLDTEMDQYSPEELHRFIDQLQQGLGEFHTEVAERYFLPVPEEAA